MKSRHPFFKNEQGDALVQVNAKTVMEYDERPLPTGRLLPVSNRPFHLSKPVAVSSLALDHNFTGLYIPSREGKIDDFAASV